jgi:uncharacterized protein
VNGPSAHRWFGLACAFELALLGSAGVLGWLFKQPLVTARHWRVGDAALGIAGAGPLLVLFGWTLHSRLRPLAEIRDFLETIIRPIFGQWRLVQLAVLSILAGVCEESLFRGFIQGRLTDTMGAATALILASVLFGVSHFVNWAYAITATLIGMYLGALWLFTGNLLVPTVTHAVYDFVALVYFLRIHRPQETSRSVQIR